MSQDFASAAMVKLLREALRLRGGRLPDTQSAADWPTVPLDVKRHWVEQLMACGGLQALVQLDEAVCSLANEPLYAGLVQYGRGSVPALVLRWQRLERYIHSRHTVRTLSTESGRLVLRHEARKQSAPPQAAEDLLVAGVLLALARASGASDVTLHLGVNDVDAMSAESALQDLVAKGDTALWTLQWQDKHVAALALAQTDQVPLPAPAQLPPELRGLWSAVQVDLIKTPDLATLATRMGQRPRSLQRRLQHCGWGFRTLIKEARASAATWWLLHSTEPVAQIGFTCGYSDQAHFTRLFKQRTGLTPGQFRRELTGA